MINAKILFCCGMLSQKTKGTNTDKLNKPDAVINLEPKTETKPVDGSIYSGITDAVYNLSNNISGWLFGSGKNNESGGNNESSEGKKSADKK